MKIRKEENKKLLWNDVKNPISERSKRGRSRTLVCRLHLRKVVLALEVGLGDVVGLSLLLRHVVPRLLMTLSIFYSRFCLRLLRHLVLTASEGLLHGRLHDHHGDAKGRV